jgi:hypothetical protein
VVDVNASSAVELSTALPQPVDENRQMLLALISLSRLHQSRQHSKKKIQALQE